MKLNGANLFEDVHAALADHIFDDEPHGELCCYAGITGGEGEYYLRKC